eukprot:Gregarina_sp_Poly_1__2988@NODE_183_length_11787_cov_91_985239_g163_i0_p3_GENE_NODE_183_length_11787_cov_91_985239_g163_i0NODE_183_length_11787_cov_91_985239_g163_i0_p3_ORF_typecomplete_len552_score108_62PWI/PF01480_17/1_7e10RRM_1/PF00076_22/3_1e09THOC7/PF05615_13/2_4e03THOC7/PF05615_13/0_019THOC7/PF05615_13/1_8e04_NODE_183_length_11787_cov_91_985239_g163_i0959311248
MSAAGTPSAGATVTEPTDATRVGTTGGALPEVLRVDYSSQGRPLNRPFGSSQDRLEAIYIGHIARDVSDELLKKILLQCGTIAKWTRSRDPMTDAPTSFGFCEFESPEAVWRVTRLINGLTLGGQQLTVTCPAKSKELVDRWHSQRLYHLQKANPGWSTDQVEQEFRHDDERVQSIVSKIAVDIEQAIVKNKADREADEAAKLSRMAAIKARLNDRRDNNRDPGMHQGRKKARLMDGSYRNQDHSESQDSKRKNGLGLSSAIAQKQARRIETVRQRMEEMATEYERKAQRWNEEIPSVRADIQRKHRRFEEAASRSFPSRRVILQMIECDFRGVQYQLSLGYLDSLGRSLNYDVGARDLVDSAGRDVDEDGIPTSRNWQKKALAERARMRAAEKKEDAADAEDEVREAEEAKAREERKLEVKRRRDKKLEEMMSALNPSAAKADNNGMTTDAILSDEKSAVDWIELKKSGFLNKEGPLQQWLVSQMEEYVGKDDSAELAEYVMDLLPPEASIIPTAESLTKELAEFLEEESELFVKALWSKLSSAVSVAKE